MDVFFRQVKGAGNPDQADAGFQQAEVKICQQNRWLHEKCFKVVAIIKKERGFIVCRFQCPPMNNVPVAFFVDFNCCCRGVIPQGFVYGNR